MRPPMILSRRKEKTAMNNLKVMMNGIIRENPTFVLLLGMCPTLGTTSSAINGMGMGLATMFVLICSNVVISSVKKLIPDMVRIDRKSTRLNSSHANISYAVFCLKKNNTLQQIS